MPTTVTINEVETGDAHPTVAPHKISDKPTKDTATIDWTPDTSDDSPIRATLVLFEGSDRETGALLEHRGLVCGSPFSVCGQDSYSLDLPAGTQREIDVTYDDTGPAADGDHDVNFFALSAQQGWN